MPSHRSARGASANIQPSAWSANASSLSYNFPILRRGGDCFRWPIRLNGPPTQAGKAQNMGKTILVVEDNELNLRLFCDLLNAHGYRAHTVRDGRSEEHTSELQTL